MHRSHTDEHERTPAALKLGSLRERLETKSIDSLGLIYQSNVESSTDPNAQTNL